MRDAIVIGARCAGATTALVLARRGLDVLLVDRAAFPSEIPHSHFIHQSGPVRLAELGLLDRVLGTGCPPVTTITTDFGDGPLTGRGLVRDGVPLGSVRAAARSTACSSRRRRPAPRCASGSRSTSSSQTAIAWSASAGARSSAGRASPSTPAW